MCLEKIFHGEIQVLANRFYKERGQEHGFALDDWFKAEKTIISRFLVGLAYIIFGLFLIFDLIPLVMNYIYIDLIEIVSWCIGWSMLGAGVGLINTRDQPQSGWLHLFGYWVFIIVAVSLISFTVSLYNSGNIYPCLDIKFYSLSATIGLIGGFLGYTFHELIRKIFVRLGNPVK